MSTVIPLPVAHSSYEVLQKENEHMRKKLEWMRRLFSNPELSPAQKLTLWAAEEEVEYRPSNDDGMTRIYMPNLSNATGLSEDTVGKNLKQLSNSEVIERKVEAKTEDGAFSKRVLIAIPSPVLRAPEKITLDKPRNHGGARFCPTCGGRHFKKRSILTCASCGTVVEDVTKDVGENDVPVCDAPERACIKCGHRCWQWNSDEQKWENSCHE